MNGYNMLICYLTAPNSSISFVDRTGPKHKTTGELVLSWSYEFVSQRKPVLIDNMDSIQILRFSSHIVKLGDMLTVLSTCIYIYCIYKKTVCIYIYTPTSINRPTSIIFYSRYLNELNLLSSAKRR